MKEIVYSNQYNAGPAPVIKKRGVILGTGGEGTPVVFKNRVLYVETAWSDDAFKITDMGSNRVYPYKQQRCGLI